MNQLHLYKFNEPTPPKKFRWEAVEDFPCSVFPEKRGNNTYWFMRKTHKGKTINLYVGKSGQLSTALLNNAVKMIKSRLGVQS